VGSSVTICRVSGIRIRINWSWLLLFGLVGVMLGVTVFPAQTPGQRTWMYIVMALLGSTLIFASVVLHELGHALQARRDGVEIEEITLWFLGGVARFKGLFPSAAVELRIALAGPLVSLLLGVFFLAVAAVDQLGTAATSVAAWLGYSNLVLLVFNLMPALPLDGGRVLRALLWRRSNDFPAATIKAVAVSRGFGGGLIGLAILLAIGGIGVSGIWLLVVGWFLIGAATAEANLGLLAAALDGLTVHDAMIADPVSLDAALRLRELPAQLSTGVAPFAAYPVTRNGSVVGLFSSATATHLPPGSDIGTRVGDVMLELPGAPTVRENEPLLDALSDLAGQPLHRALVRADGSVVGLLSVTDVERIARERMAAVTATR
jgi:Zn-dependent protease/CBS domain-containing protein